MPCKEAHSHRWHVQFEGVTAHIQHDMANLMRKKKSLQPSESRHHALAQNRNASYHNENDNHDHVRGAKPKP